jgi:putative PIN family toxin of toxin-antitoxin system
MVRVVVDTNILVSALIYHGKPHILVLKLLEGHTVILSRQMLAELADVLTRDKFAVKTSQVDRFLAVLVRKSKVVTPSSRFKIISEDPDDDVVLNTAYAGKAEYIVTGDRHLLALREFKRIKIVKVAQMLESLR